MAEKNIAKPVEAKTEKQPTVVSYIKDHAQKGAKTRAELAKKVFEHMTKKGITKNSKGLPIREEKVLSLLNAMCRDINSSKTGWWSTWEVVETADSFVMRAKQTN